MAYITISTMLSLSRTRTLKTEHINLLEQMFTSLNLSLLATAEKYSLTRLIMFMEDLEGFIKLDYAEEKKDTYEYAIPVKGKHKYHTNNQCKFLHKDFKNFRIPKPIREKGKSEINEFRKWFKQSCIHLLDKEDYEAIKMRIRVKYGVEVNAKELFAKWDNTEYEKIENLSEVEIIDLLKTLIEDESKYFSERVSFLTPYIKSLNYIEKNQDKEIIRRDNCSMSDKEVKEELLYYNQNYRKPILDLLKSFLINKYSNDGKIMTDEKLLYSLNFEHCKACEELNSNKRG